MEEDKQNFFDESEENIIDAEEIPPLDGICPKCLGSDFVIYERNGVQGVLFTAQNIDSEGKPIKTLVHCDCKVKVDY